MTNPLRRVWDGLRGSHSKPDESVVQRADARLEEVERLQEKQIAELHELQGRIRERRLSYLKNEADEQNRRLGRLGG